MENNLNHYVHLKRELEFLLVFDYFPTHLSLTRIQLQCLECMLLLLTPSPRLVIACKNGEKLGDQAKVLDKLTVVVRQAQENTKSRNIDQ